MIRVVLDTNVLVAASISPSGPNAQILDLIVGDKVRPFVTAAVIEEYERVFEYERLRYLDQRRVANVLRLLNAAATKVKSRGRLKISRHEDDNRIYECAYAAKAHYIVTENAAHFPEPHKYTQIVNARQLLDMLKAEKK